MRDQRASSAALLRVELVHQVSQKIESWPCEDLPRLPRR
jgi:hypothetical protein